MDTLAGRYEIIQVLGRGGFAITFLAKDNLQPSKPICVVKQLRPNQTNPRVVEFFEKEAAILEKLGKHPQIPQLLAHFNENNNLYIVQEFIKGQDLSQEITPGKQLSEGYVVKFLQDTLEVLSFVHNQGVVHRDIKPQNLMRRSEDGKIFLIDFGAVKEVGTLLVNRESQITPSVVIGTPGYMANEQRRGKPILSSDIYALGMTAVQALTGFYPSQLEEDPLTGEIVWRHLTEISDRLFEVISKMVRHHYSLRYPSANQALQALIEAEASPVEAKIILRDTKQEFLQEAESRAKQGNGQLSVFSLRILESRRIELGLSDSEASVILQQVLRPYREYERKLQEYEQAFIEAVNNAYPFNLATEKDLQDYRQHLGLELEDIIAIEQRVLQPKQLESEYQPTKMDRLQQEREKVKAEQIIQTQQFDFEYATVNIKRKGLFRTKSTCSISYHQGRGEYLIENLDNSLTLEMVAIPGGSFIIGSSENEEGRYETESPQNQVQVQPFFIGKYLITQAQWKAVATLPKVNIDLKPDPSHFKGNKRPVENISWDEAMEFCARLSFKLDKSYRLPTEAEWEYACRARTTTPFSCGGTITTDLANFNGDYTYGYAAKGQYRAETSEVGIFPPNAFGLYDMHGNVWEWCQDKWHDNYNQVPDEESTWVVNNDGDDFFVVRGGSWGSLPRCCRSSRRDKLARDGKNGILGFRVVF